MAVATMVAALRLAKYRPLIGVGTRSATRVVQPGLQTLLMKALTAFSEMRHTIATVEFLITRGMAATTRRVTRPNPPPVSRMNPFRFPSFSTILAPGNIEHMARRLAVAETRPMRVLSAW